MIPQAIEKMRADLSNMDDKQLASMATQMSHTGSPGALFVAMEMKRRADMRNGAMAAQAPQATVVDQLAQQLASPALSPQMPPQGMPPQGMPPQGMPPQGMPPQGMPPQGMPEMPPQTPPEMAMDQGVGSLPYEPQYEQGGIVSFSEGGDKGERKRSDATAAYWNAMDQGATQRGDFFYDTLNNIAYLPALAADVATSPINSLRMGIKNLMVDLSPEGLEYAKKTGRSRSFEDADPTNPFPFSSGLSPFGYRTTAMHNFNAEAPRSESEQLASAIDASKQKENDETRQALRQLSDERAEREKPPAPFDPNRPPAIMGLAQDETAEQPEKPEEDQFAGYSISPADAGTPAAPAANFFDAARRAVAQGGISGLPTPPPKIEYPTQYSEKEMSPEAIKAEKEAFDRTMGVDPDFYKKQAADYSKDNEESEKRAGSQRWMDLSKAFLTMASTPGNFVKGLTAGMDKGLESLKLTNKELQDRKDRNKEAQRLLAVKEEAEKRGDAKTAYEAKIAMEKINRQNVIDEIKANAEREQKVYDAQSRSYDSRASDAARVAVAEAQVAAETARAKATSEANAQQKALDRASRERVATAQLKLRIANLGAKERQMDEKAITDRVKTVNQVEVLQYLLSKAQENNPGVTMDMVQKQYKDGRIKSEVILKAKRAIAITEMFDPGQASMFPDYGSGNVFDMSNFPGGMGSIPGFGNEFQ